MHTTFLDDDVIIVRSSDNRTQITQSIVYYFLHPFTIVY